MSSHASPAAPSTPIADPTAIGLICLAIGCAALMLIVIAARTGRLAFAGGLDAEAALSIIEAVGLLAAGVVAPYG